MRGLIAEQSIASEEGLRPLAEELWRPVEVLARWLKRGILAYESSQYVLRNPEGGSIAHARELEALAAALDQAKIKHKLSLRVQVSRNALRNIRELRNGRESISEFVRTAIQREIERRRAEDLAWCLGTDEPQCLAAVIP